MELKVVPSLSRARRFAMLFKGGHLISWPGKIAE
jgi:hypothetical protein